MVKDSITKQPVEGAIVTIHYPCTIGWGGSTSTKQSGSTDENGEICFQIRIDLHHQICLLYCEIDDYYRKQIRKPLYNLKEILIVPKN